MRQTIPETCLPNICACGTRADLPWLVRPVSRALHMFAAVTKFVAVRGTCIAIHSCGERSKAKQRWRQWMVVGPKARDRRGRKTPVFLARADSCTQGMLTSDSFASKPKCRRGREYLPSLRHLVSVCVQSEASEVPGHLLDPSPPERCRWGNILH